jgi:hypothetical protein
LDKWKHQWQQQQQQVKQQWDEESKHFGCFPLKSFSSEGGFLMFYVA